MRPKAHAYRLGPPLRYGLSLRAAYCQLWSLPKEPYFASEAVKRLARFTLIDTEHVAHPSPARASLHMLRRQGAAKHKIR